MRVRRSRRTQWVPVREIVTGNHHLNQEKLKKYLMWFTLGSAIPPLTVSRFGEKYLLADGHHRLEVAKRRGLAVVEVIGA